MALRWFPHPKPLNKLAGSLLAEETLQSVGEDGSDFAPQCSKPFWLSANPSPTVFFFGGSQMLRMRPVLEPTVLNPEGV